METSDGLPPQPTTPVDAPIGEPVYADLLLTESYFSEVGEVFIYNIFATFSSTAQAKITAIAQDNAEQDVGSICSKLLVGVDSKFDRTIAALSVACHSCIAPFCDALLQWWRDTRGQPVDPYSYSTSRKRTSSHSSHARNPSNERRNELLVLQKQAMGADYLFGRVLIGIMENCSDALPEKISLQIENLTFQTLINSETMFAHLNSESRNDLVELYASVIGEMTKTRFASPTELFLTTIRKNDKQSINLIKGMEKVHLKYYPIEELEISAHFLVSLGEYFITIKGRPEIKQAVADLFVSLLSPWAATFKSERNIPGVKSFVELVYPKAIKSKQITIMLSTLILCISQKALFLERWPHLLSQCLLQMKDSKHSGEAILSIHRCLWVYMYRVGGQSNAETESRLKSIIAKCFPKSPSTGVFPKDTPIDAFVDIFLFMSEIRADFVFKEAIFPLLGKQTNKLKVGNFCPIRMAVAIKAARAIIDTRIQKQKPSFCATSLNMNRAYKSELIDKLLTEDETVDLGLHSYMNQVRESLGNILSFMNSTVTTEEFILKKKEDTDDYIELYIMLLTCIPRLFPVNIPEEHVIQTICFATTHPEQRLRSAACDALKRIIEHLPYLSHVVIESFADFLLHSGDDNGSIIDPALKMLQVLVLGWLKCLEDPSNNNFFKAYENFDKALMNIERLCLVCLCSSQPFTRRLAINLLKSIKTEHCQDNQVFLLNVINESSPKIVKDFLSIFSQEERTRSDINHVFDIADIRSSNWHVCLGGLMKCVVNSKCERLLPVCWQVSCMRFLELFTVIDHDKKLTDLAGGDHIAIYAKASGHVFSKFRLGLSREEKLSDDTLNLWINYLTMLCAAAPNTEPTPPSSSSGSISSVKGSISNKPSKAEIHVIVSTTELFRSVLPFIRHDDDKFAKKILHSLSAVNSASFLTLVAELKPFHGLCSSLKSDRKKRILRERLACILEYSSKCLADTQILYFEAFKTYFLDYVNDTLTYLRSLEVIYEEDKKLGIYFSNHIHLMMEHVARMDLIDSYFSPELRRTLYEYFARDFGYKKTPRTPSVSYKGPVHLTLGRNRKKSNSVTKESQRVSFSKVRGMVSMCYGRLFDESALDTESYLFKDISFMFNILKLRPLGQRAVEMLLFYNQDANNNAMMDLVLKLCYISEPIVSQGFFLALANTLLREDYIVPNDCVIRIVCIVLFQTGNSSQSIRNKAIGLITKIVKKYLRGSQALPQQLSLTSVLSATYTLSQQELSGDLSKYHAEHAQQIIKEMIKRVPLVSHAGQHIMLQCLVPWMAHIDLVNNLNEGEFLICCLFDLTVRFEPVHPKGIESLWIKIAENIGNVQVIINFLTFLGAEAAHTSAIVLPHAQKIAIYLGRAHPDVTFDTLASLLSVTREYDWTEFTKTKTFLRKFLISNNEDLEIVKMSTMLFALCASVELVTEAPVDILKDHLPLMIQPLFVHLDSQSALVRRMLKILLSNIIHSLVISHVDSETTTYEKAQLLIESLIQKGDYLWKQCDIRSSSYDTMVNCLQKMVEEITQLLSIAVPAIQDLWAYQAHVWGVYCQNSHDAERSLQIFRTFNKIPSANIFVDIISRLSNAVVDQNVYVHIYVIELLLTIKTLVKQCSPELLKQNPQIAWAAIVILDSDQEEEWTYAIQIINCILDKISLIDVENLVPQLNWIEFQGLQDIVIKGLTSSVNIEITIDTLVRFTTELDMDHHHIIDPKNKGALFNIISLAPYLITGFDHPSERQTMIAQKLSHVCNTKNLQNLSKLFALYGNHESTYIKSLSEWVKAICKYLSESFFPQFETEVLNLILNLLESKNKMYETSLFIFLHYLILSIDVKKSNFSIQESEPNNLVLVLIRSLRRDVWENALPAIEAAMNKWKPSKKDFRDFTAHKFESPKRKDCWDIAYDSQSRTRKRLNAVAATFGVENSLQSLPVLFSNSNPTTKKTDRSQSFLDSTTNSGNNSTHGSLKCHSRSFCDLIHIEDPDKTSNFSVMTDTTSMLKGTSSAASNLSNGTTNNSLGTPIVASNLDLQDFFQDFDGFLMEALIETNGEENISENELSGNISNVVSRTNSLSSTKNNSPNLSRSTSRTEPSTVSRLNSRSADISRSNSRNGLPPTPENMSRSNSRFGLPPTESFSRSNSRTGLPPPESFSRSNSRTGLPPPLPPSPAPPPETISRTNSSTRAKNIISRTSSRTSQQSNNNSNSNINTVYVETTVTQPSTQDLRHLGVGFKEEEDEVGFLDDGHLHPTFTFQQFQKKQEDEQEPVVEE